MLIGKFLVFFSKHRLIRAYHYLFDYEFVIFVDFQHVKVTYRDVTYRDVTYRDVTYRNVTYRNVT